MEVHHPVFYVSLGHMQNNMRSSVTLKLKLKLTLTLTVTLTDTGGAVLTLMLGYRPGGELPWQTPFTGCRIGLWLFQRRRRRQQQLYSAGDVMSNDGNTAPVYGPPKRDNYAEWKRECRNEQPLPATVQASKDRFQRALLGCHLPPSQSNVDGAVAASLTHREQRPPKPPFRCPDRFSNRYALSIVWLLLVMYFHQSSSR